jgi:uncharacterized membrane protein YgcG
MNRIIFMVGWLNLPISISTVLDSMIATRRTTLSIIVVLTGLALVTTSAIVTPAFAIKRFFNCMTDIANKHGKLDLTDVNNCYDKKYHTGPYATHSNSDSGADSGSSSTSSSGSGSGSGSHHH